VTFVLYLCETHSLELTGVHVGSTTGLSEESDHDLPFTPKDEPATLPRVQELIVITEHSPWCTFVKNETGVTLGDITNQMTKE
jgi:hypothetical protein